MTSTQVLETSVTNDSFSWDVTHPNNLIPCSILRYRFRRRNAPPKRWEALRDIPSKRLLTSEKTAAETKFNQGKSTVFFTVFFFLTDINECLTSPCQHTCTNTFGSYTCQCYSCYTKLGTRCELRQCKISGSCYSYRSVNPNNQCQVRYLTVRSKEQCHTN